VRDPTLLRVGSQGVAVRDLQQRLGALGHASDPDEPGEFGAGTDRAVRQFQDRRGLQVDGLVGRHTWASLVESGLRLGDRLLYARRPMLRGDDVAELQRRLNTLGFDAGRVDGILGTDTTRALTEFQQSTGLAGDGICGPETIDALIRVGTLADGSITAVRERDALRHGPHRLAGRSLFVAAVPGLAVVGESLARGLSVAGAVTLLDASGDDESLVARAANAFAADLFVSLRFGADDAPACAYFETPGWRSETGYMIANVVREYLEDVLSRPVSLVGRAYPLLRETRMTAVACELSVDGDADALAGVVRRSGDVARAIVRAIRDAYEAPPQTQGS